MKEQSLSKINEDKLFPLISKGPFTIVNIFLLVQSVQRGEGA